MRTSNNIQLKTLLIILTLSFSSTAMAKIYKWTDSNGKTHYTATPPPAKAKAKTEEFKIQKVKKSSLTRKSVESNNSSHYSTKNASNKTGNAQSQCSKAVNKYPAVLSKLKRKINKAKSAGKISDLEYSKAMKQVQTERRKVQSISDCVKDYNRGGRDSNTVDLIANNSAADALTYLMLGAAFDQAEQKYKKK